MQRQGCNGAREPLWPNVSWHGCKWPTSWRATLILLSTCLCRYYHPSPPTRTVKQERSFEGISLETPGSSSKSVLQMSRFQLCQECYSAASEAAAAVRASSSLPLAAPLSSLKHRCSAASCTPCSCCHLGRLASLAAAPLPPSLLQRCSRLHASQ